MIKRLPIGKIGSAILAGLFVLSNAGCKAIPPAITPMTITARPSMPPIGSATLIPSTTSVSSTTQPPEEESPSPTYPPTPTPIPDAWLTYTNPALHVQFRYPPDWQPETPTRYSSAEGYFEWSIQTYPASEFDSYITLCVLEANENKPAAFSSDPFITTWQGLSSQSGNMVGYGCTVSPANDQPAGPRDQAVLYARYPQPWPRDMLFVLRTDSAHFSGILSTLQFTDYVTPTPHPVNIYNAPACAVPLPDPSSKTSHFAGMTTTEYPIVNADCDPLAHFDGFQARVRALNLDEWARYETDRQRRAEAANRLIGPFSYRLAGRQVDLGGGNPVLASRQTTVFDLYKGDEKLATDITQIGPVSLNASGDDFILWVENTDTQEATEVGRDTLRKLDWWVSGFNTALVGPNLVRYAYASDHLFPVGAASQTIVYRNNEVIYNLSIPEPGSASNPVQWLWAWQGHWVLEVGNVVVQDGVLQNPKLGYDEMFAWHLVNGSPFYFFSKSGVYGLSYAGRTLPQHFDDIIHGLLCCEPAAYSLNSSSEGAWFYALKDKVWYLVSVLVKLTSVKLTS